MPYLINASQLDKFRKQQKNVILLDASWHLPQEGREAEKEFLAQHIVGARFLNLDDFHHQTVGLPHILINDEKIINEKLGELGITNDHKLFFYDNSDLHTSCRALWMFQVFGHTPNQLYILDGGYNAWKKYGGKIEMTEPHFSANKTYHANFQASLLRTLPQMKKNLHHPEEQVIDLRHAVRYAGGAEPREGMRCGHIPKSFCFPYMTMFDKAGYFKPIDKIQKQLIGVGIDLNTPIATTCGSGISAAILNFVLDLMNHDNHALYDGSWSEWGADTLYAGESSLNERPVHTIFDE